MEHQGFVGDAEAGSGWKLVGFQKYQIDVIEMHSAALFRLGIIALSLMGSMIMPQMLSGQQGSFWDDTDLTLLETGGSIGLTASAYSATGIENRRAPGVLQTNANFSFNTLGFRSGIVLNYSTDESGLRQNMNDISYRASWRWLTLQAGDVNARFSDYGLNGTTIRGGYLRAEPGKFLFELTGGRSRRAVRPSFDTGFREPSFEQWAVGGKIGIGRESGSFLHLSSFYAQDRVASLEDGAVEIKPKENLTVTPDLRLELFGNRLSFESQVTVSAFTRDLKATALTSDDLNIPPFITAIYQPRVSTRLNYAGQATASFRSTPFDLTLGYERIQPGFLSLGRARIRDDRETLTLSPTLRFFRNRLSIQADLSMSRDNLLNTQIQTQSMTQAAADIQMVISESFTLTTSYQLLLNDVTSSPQGETDINSGGQSQESHNIMLQPNFIFSGEEASHTVSLTGGYLSIKSDLFGLPGVGRTSLLSETFTGMLTYAVSFRSGVTLSGTGNYLGNQSEAGDITNLGLNAGISYALINRNLTVGVNAGLNSNQFNRDLPGGDRFENRLRLLNGSINGSYRLTDRDSFSLTVRTRSSMVIEGNGSDFSELEGSFSYQRTF